MNRSKLLTLRAHSLMRLGGITRGIDEFREGYCTPWAWRLFPIREEDMATFWSGERALPHRLQICLRRGVGDLVQWRRYACALECAGVRRARLRLVPGTKPWRAPATY
jgi:hypothetical protein